jgi:hypothetical protein
MGTEMKRSLISALTFLITLAASAVFGAEFTDKTMSVGSCSDHNLAGVWQHGRCDGGSNQRQDADLIDQNVTIIEKTNLQWPMKGAISVDSCSYLICLAI